jgi:polysaccharide pyruvyl transferase WcaK-like protein
MIWGRKKRAVVVGPYRVHNFGDDLVGAIIVKHLQRRGYKVVVPLLGAGNAEWLGIEHRETYDGVFADADTVVIGGGGIMSDTAGVRPGGKYLEIVTQAAIAGQFTGKRVFVTSVGAGPWLVERSKMMAFGVSMIADKVGVRDRESLDHLAGIGVAGSKIVLGADCALLSDDYLGIVPQPNSKIGVQFNTGHYPEFKDNPQVEAIGEAVRAYVGANASRVVLISNGRKKSPLTEHASASESLEYELLKDFLPRMAGLKAMFTSHLHLAIAAYSQRIPTFSIYVREKTKRFYDQIGRPERAIDLTVATKQDFERLIAATETATWTDGDEATLQRVQTDARKLLTFVK